MKYRLSLLPALVAILSLLTVLANADANQTKTHFAPDQKIAVPTTTPEQPSNFTLDFNLPSGDVQFAGVVFFIPSEWGIVKGGAIPIGASVGQLDARATLGLVGGPCSTSLPVTFDLMNASINTKDTVPYADTDQNGTPDFAEDKNNDGIQDGIEKYPDFLNRSFKELQPIRRSAGITIVASTAVILQFLIFPPGTKINENIPNDASLGYPTVTVLQNIGDPGADATPGPITSFCTPLTSKNTTFGATPEGKAIFMNPKPGKYTFTTIAVGQRDADGDGIENSLDTCPFTPNVGDPRIQYSGDADGDGLDAACDPNDNPATGGTNSDQDGDGYLNHQDNCPLIPNGEEEAKVPNVGNQKDSDLDQIGDACDPHPNTPDGELSKATLKTDITIGDGSGPGGRPSNCPDCYDPNAAPSSGNSGTSSGGGSSTSIIIIIIAVIVAVAVVGGGGFFLMRRRRGG